MVPHFSLFCLIYSYTVINPFGFGIVIGMGVNYYDVLLDGSFVPFFAVSVFCPEYSRILVIG